LVKPPTNEYSAKSIVACIFGYLGAAQLLIAAIFNWYLMPDWMYYPAIFPVSFPFAIIVLIGTTLTLKRQYLIGGISMLGASITSMLLTILFPLRIIGLGLEVLSGAILALVGGIFAILAEKETTLIKH
jgi:hypothetical protein